MFESRSVTVYCSCVYWFERAIPLYRHMYLYIWCPISGTVWGGGTALLGEIIHWGWALSVLSLIPLLFLCFVFHIEDMISHLPDPTIMPPIAATSLQPPPQ